MSLAVPIKHKLLEGQPFRGSHLKNLFSAISFHAREKKKSTGEGVDLSFCLRKASLDSSVFCTPPKEQ